MRRNYFISLIAIVVVVTLIAIKFLQSEKKVAQQTTQIQTQDVGDWWMPPSLNSIPGGDEGEMIKYGRNLIANTALYFGPNGSIAKAGNGMNCQNCHLEAGTRPWGNNFSAVYSTYPKFRERSGSMEQITKRVNDCFQRSLHGNPIDTTSREMLAIIHYMKWLGKAVNKGTIPKGAGIREPALLDRAADPVKGRKIYLANCVLCHREDGFGIKDSTGKYVYPPLWGPNSYTTAAGLFRLSRFAGYVKENMPWGASHQKNKLTTEEAWDVAAFVNSQPRPVIKFKEDWPNIAGKPYDHPFGPYADSFSEQQHKYGPFGPIKKYKEQLALKKNTAPVKK